MACNLIGHLIGIILRFRSVNRPRYKSDHKVRHKNGNQPPLSEKHTVVDGGDRSLLSLRGCRRQSRGNLKLEIQLAVILLEIASLRSQ